MDKRIFPPPLFLLFFLNPIAAQAAGGWPDTIALLIEEQTQVQACVEQLKNSGNAGAIREGRETYNAARAAANGAIAGLTTGLVEGYEPQELAGIQANLTRAGAGVQEVCNDAIKAASAKAGTKGVLDKIVTAAVAPVIDALTSGAGALWARHLQQGKLEIETIKSQLEAAKWPEFGGASGI